MSHTEMLKTLLLFWKRNFWWWLNQQSTSSCSFFQSPSSAEGRENLKTWSALENQNFTGCCRMHREIRTVFPSLLGSGVLCHVHQRRTESLCWSFSVHLWNLYIFKNLCVFICVFIIISNAFVTDFLKVICLLFGTCFNIWFNKLIIDFFTGNDKMKHNVFSFLLILECSKSLHVQKALIQLRITSE